MAGPESATAVPVALRPDMAQPPPPAALAPPKADVKPPAEAKPLAPVPPAKPADKAAPPIDPAKLLEATKLLEQMCPSLEPMKESREQFAAAPPPPRTIDHLKFAAVDLAAIVKNIPGAKYYPHETYTGGGSADVIRAPSGKPIIRKTVEDGHKIIESYMKPDELAYELRKLPPAQLALVREVLNGQVGEISPATIQAHEQAEQAKQVEAQR